MTSFSEELSLDQVVSSSQTGVDIRPLARKLKLACCNPPQSPHPPPPFPPHPLDRHTEGGGTVGEAP